MFAALKKRVQKLKANVDMEKEKKKSGKYYSFMLTPKQSKINPSTSMLSKCLSLTYNTIIISATNDIYFFGNTAMKFSVLPSIEYIKLV